jgi:hypothetical protein
MGFDSLRSVATVRAERVVRKGLCFASRAFPSDAIHFPLQSQNAQVARLGIPEYGGRQ